MAYAAFFATIALASIAWTAFWTAAAARLRHAWARHLLGAIGLGLPLFVGSVQLLAAVFLAYERGLRPNWCPAVLATVLAAAVGCVGVFRAGTHTDAPWAAPPARSWSAACLFVIWLGTATVACFLLAAIDHRIAAEARAMRAQAAALMLETLPAPQPAFDAGRLHARIAAALAADPALTEDGGLLAAKAKRPSADAIAALLARHADMLDTIRRAADLPGCRFVGDWTRPAVDTSLPEAKPMLAESRFLALAARHEAESGALAEALADTCRIAGLGRHAAAQPSLVWQRVATEIETSALETLAAVLPAIGPDDDRLLDGAAIDALFAPLAFSARDLAADDALLLHTLAGIADGRIPLFRDPFGIGTVPFVPQDPHDLASAPLTLFHRMFLLPGDIVACRETFRRMRRTLDSTADRPGSWPELAAGLSDVEDDIRGGRIGGLFAASMLPAVTPVARSRTALAAKREAARVLVAATRHRLATGTLPDSLEDLVPSRLPVVPIDPFTGGAQISMASRPEGLVAWSVGPDRVDQGGPPLPGTDPEGQNGAVARDDVGLWLPAASSPSLSSEAD
jgi:hypothetical protein